MRWYRPRSPQGSHALGYGEQVDELLPYGVGVHAETHPLRLATLAVLRGVTATPVARCRVLELGCAQAGNILYLADAYPEAQFVGVELSAAEVAIAHELVATLGLTNIKVHALDIADIDSSFGQFDYVIAHGVYSWVPDEVRDHILHVCASQLAPGGLAYISYNVYPGWSVGEAVRTILRDHVHALDDPAEQVAAARVRLQSLANEADASTPWGALLATRCEQLLGFPDAYLDHEYLGPFSTAYHLHEMVAHLDAHGLRYLDDLIVTEAPPIVQRASPASGLADVRNQQLHDLVNGTAFRAALVCRGDEPIGPPPRIDDLMGLHVSAPLSVEGQLVVDDFSEGEFVTRKGGALRSTSPVMKAALAALAGHWPAAMTVGELAAVVDAWTAPELRAEAAGNTARHLVRELMGLHRQGIAEFAIDSYPFTTELSDRPIVAPATRLLAGRSAMVGNRRHEELELDEVLLAVARLLDGTRSPEDVVAALATHPGQRAELEQLVPRAVQILAGNALLVG